MNYIILIVEVVGIVILAYSFSVVKNLISRQKNITPPKSYLALSGMLSYFTSLRIDCVNEVYKIIPEQKKTENQQIYGDKSVNSDGLVFEYQISDYRFEYKKLTNRMTAVKYTGIEE